MTSEQSDPPVTAHSPAIEWDPRSPDVVDDQIRAYDDLRARLDVARGPDGTWAVLRHGDAVRVLDDHATFSNVVSSRTSVPNGMDPPDHTVFRAVVDRFFTPDRMAAFEPVCRDVATDLVGALPRGRELDAMAVLAEPFANRVQCGFMGWPDRLHEPLRAWTRRNQSATRAADREQMAAVALEFDAHIREQLDDRRSSPAPPDDTTTQLMRETVDGRPLTDEEIVSIVRNWTVGELATIAASVGIVLHQLATRPSTTAALRSGAIDLDAACDEMLRIHAPLVANRRRTTRDVTVGGRHIPAGDTVLVVWASANRDESVTGDPDALRVDRDPEDNLLYGRGIHACPGAPLARLELRVLLEVFLAATDRIELGQSPAVRAAFPASGFSVLPVRID